MTTKKQAEQKPIEPISLVGIDRPWEKLDSETAHWFEVFDIYRLMSPYDRSIVGAIRITMDQAEKKHSGLTKTQPKKKKVTRGQINKAYEMSQKYRWRDRVMAYDVYVRERRQIQAEEREDKIFDQLSTLQEKLLTRIDTMMDFPLMTPVHHQEITDDGKVINNYTINPTGFSPVDISRSIRDALQIAKTLRPTGKLAMSIVGNAYLEDDKDTEYNSESSVGSQKIMDAEFRDMDTRELAEYCEHFSLPGSS